MTRKEAIKIVKEFINGTCLHMVGREALETLIPELRESEDERIRKDIIKYLKTVNEVESDCNHSVINEWLAWLEKQKEQKHPNGCFTCDEYKKGYEEGRRNGFTAGYNKAIKEVEQNVEQKPAECIKTEELAEHIKAEFESFRNLLKKKGIDYQPAETYWTDFARLFVSSAKKLQKPAEWGEDDQLIGFIFDLLNDLVWRKDFAMSKEECLERLKSLRPQPKQEWSHDDTQHRNKILLDLRNRQARYAEDKRKNWKDADFYDCCMKDNGENIEWLESLPKRFNLRPSWKPSKEQIRAVFDASERNDKLGSILRNLYDDLKKLM